MDAQDSPDALLKDSDSVHEDVRGRLDAVKAEEKLCQGIFVVGDRGRRVIDLFDPVLQTSLLVPR